MTDKPCHCPCHTYPGIYPTSKEKPCLICGHVHSEGNMTGSIVDGFIENPPQTIRLKDVLVEGNDTIDLSKLVGKQITRVVGYASNRYGGPGFQLSRIYFDDGTFVFVEGEYDFPYIVGDQPNLDDETLLRLQNGEI